MDSLKELVENEKTAEYFNLRSSNSVYLNFLYKKEKYEEVLDFAEKVISEMTKGEGNLRRSYELDNALIVYLAAAIKICGPETLKRARNLTQTYSEFLSKLNYYQFKRRLYLKQVMLYHWLCVKNNEFSEALETFSPIQMTNHYEFLNAKAAILIKLGRVEECIVTINKILDSQLSPGKPRYIFTDTIQQIKSELEKNPNEELQSKIDSLDQEIILDAKIEDTILNMQNAQPIVRFDGEQFGNNRFGNNRFGNDRAGGNRFSDNERFGNNRFGNRQFGENRQFGGGNRGRFNNDRFGENRFGGNRFGGNRDRFDGGDNDGEGGFRERGGFNNQRNDFNDRFSNNNRFNNRQTNFNRFNDESGERKPFRPFQTRFKEESNDII